MKKTIALMLALVMCASLLSGCNADGDSKQTEKGSQESAPATTSSAGTNPAETGPEPDLPDTPDSVFTYTYENGVLTISGTGVLDDDAMTALGVYDAISREENFQVVLMEGVTEIGDFAFSNYGGLTSVTLPMSVTKIGSGAFVNCRSLTSVTIRNPSTIIAADAFDSNVTIEWAD